MKNLKKQLLSLVCLLGLFSTINAQYTEVINSKGLTKNLKKDYGLVDDNAKTNQSEKIQKAIDEVSEAGGGQITLPKGTYKFGGVYFKSNVHLLVEANTVIKPHWPKGEKAVVFIMDVEPLKGKNKSNANDRDFIENVSIRGIEGSYIIDYSDRIPMKGEGCRGILTKMVKNFLIADLDVKDNFTTYCGITLTPTRSKTKDVSNWEVSRSTNGTIKNCRIFNGSPGYGLVQLHGAQNVYFENLYANGGVTLRLETGAVGEHTGVFNITAKNIVNENGRCAVMLGPHSAQNGVVKIDGVKSIGSTFAVQIGMGGVKKKELQRNPDAKPGSFAEGTSIKNIHAIFGMKAQVKKHALLAVPEAYYSDLKLWNDNKFFDGPSIAPVVNELNGEYSVVLENITSEGFKYYGGKKIVSKKDFRKGKWPVEFQKWKKSQESKNWRVNKGPVVKE